MILPPAAGQFWAGKSATGGGGTPPTGDPVGVGLLFVSGTSKVKALWTDPAGTLNSIHVGIYPDNTGPTALEPAFVAAVISPGVEYWNSHYDASSLNYLRDGTSLFDWWVRSENDGLVGSWVYLGNSKA